VEERRIVLCTPVLFMHHNLLAFDCSAMLKSKDKNFILPLDLIRERVVIWHSILANAIRVYQLKGQLFFF